MNNQKTGNLIDCMLFANRLFWRDLLAGNYTVFLLAVFVSITCVTSIQFLANRVEFSISKDMKASLASDLRILSDRRIDDSILKRAKELNLSTVVGVQFPTMVSSGEKSVLVSLKAVTDSYPLRGDLIVSTGKEKQKASSSMLRTREAYVDSSMLSRLNISNGDTFKLSGRDFIAKAYIEVEPDRGLSFVNFAPRVLIKNEDLSNLGLLKPGSRASYRVWVAAEESNKLEAFTKFARENLQKGQSLETFEVARPELRDALKRIRSFLSLISLLTIILGAIAISMAASYIMKSHAKALVTLKVFGASEKYLKNMWLLILSSLTVISFATSVLSGFVLQKLIFWHVNKYSDINLPDVSVVDPIYICQIFFVTLILVFLFSYPFFSSVIKQPVINIYRKTFFKDQKFNLGSFLFTPGFFLSFLMFIILLYLCVGDLLLSAIVFLFFVSIGVCFFFVSVFLINLIKKAKDNFFNFELGWVFQNFFRSINRRRTSISLQVLVLGVAISSLVSSTFVEQRLLKIWDSVIAENAPNFFLLNIQPDQKIEIGKFLEGLVGNHSLYPMVRGRLIAINGANVDKSKYQSVRAKRLISREMNMSYGNMVPEYNQITSGKNFSGSRAELSVEQDIAKTLGIKLSDLITFDVGGELVTLEVTSLRKVKWESMEVNFFMFASPDKVQDKPQTFITAFHYNSSQNGSGFANIQQLILEKFPNVTVVDTSIIVGQVQKVLKDAVNIIKLFFSFSVIGAFLVLWSSLLALKEERERETALLRILGCSKNLLISAQFIELVFIGALAGSVGSVFAQLFGNIIFYTIFDEIGFDFSWMYVIVGVAITIIVSIMAGFHGLFRISRHSSVTNLRMLPQ